MTKEIKGKICASAACRFAGQMQPIENFDVNVTSKQPFRTYLNLLCRVCRAKKSKKKDIVTEKFNAAKEEGDQLSASAMAAISSVIPTDNPAYIEKNYRVPFRAAFPVKDDNKHQSDNKYLVTIDFSKHQDVFNDLIDLADERLRDPDKMIIFILLKIFQEGVKINETISTN